jgi:hypothetical protein
MKLIYGDPPNDNYILIEDHDELLIVHTDYLYQESAILFTVGHPMTDWSDDMLLNKAVEVVDSLNKKVRG